MLQLRRHIRSKDAPTVSADLEQDALTRLDSCRSSGSSSTAWRQTCSDLGASHAAHLDTIPSRIEVGYVVYCLLLALALWRLDQAREEARNVHAAG